MIWAFALALIVVSCSSTKEVTTTAEKPVVVEQTKKETSSKEKGVYDLLSSMNGVVEVNKLSKTDHFTEHYEVWFDQMVDPNNGAAGRFKQRVLVAHSSFDAPVIVELQGYKIWTERAGELAKLFQGNQITIEHRYFENSRPRGSIPWETLTVSNAAYDQHVIIESIKQTLYPKNKYISTGISKGGQTTMIHRSLYPNDVDASVCYVTPLNFEREDPRIQKFLETVGTPEQRQQIQDFQLRCLQQKDDLVKELEKVAKEKEYTWDFSTEVALEYYVLEYSFAFWQWGAYGFDQIPDASATPEEMLLHVLSVSGVSFFESKGIQAQRPFFYAAMSEMGMYDYKTEPFKEYLSQSTYNFEFTVPGNMAKKYDKIRMDKVKQFMIRNATKMLFIYGELDTWSATAVDLPDDAYRRGLAKFVLEGGNHGTRIRHFSASDQRQIIGTIEKYIETAAKGNIKK